VASLQLSGMVWSRHDPLILPCPSGKHIFLLYEGMCVLVKKFYYPGLGLLTQRPYE